MSEQASLIGSKRVDLTTSYCPNPGCPVYGEPGYGVHLVRRGRDGPTPRLKCNLCGRTFSARYGTAYFDIRTEEAIYTIAIRALAEGNSLRGTGRIVGVDKDTVCDWLDRAGRHCRAVTNYFWQHFHLRECQLDELWSFVRKKEGHLTPAEKVLGLYGDAWVWIAFAPDWRLVVAFVAGKREQTNANRLVARVKARSGGHLPFFTSDQLPHYARALLQQYGVPEVLIHIPGKRGRKAHPKLLPPRGLDYAQIVKQRQGRRVVRITTRVVFGSPATVQARLAESHSSDRINTSLVERHNLTCRQCNGRLSRKVLSFSKELSWLEKHLWLTFAYYHFVLPHASLARPLLIPEPTRGRGSPKQWPAVTPAMAAGLTDHGWTMDELLSYRVPPQFLTLLEL